MSKNPPRRSIRALQARVRRERPLGEPPGEPPPPGEPLSLDQTVAEINAIGHEGALATAMALGERVLEWFEVNGDEDVSWRALAEHPALRIDHSTLWRSVEITRQHRALPPNVAEALDFSHQRALLPLKDPDKKLALAEEAIRENLTSKELVARVAEARKKAPAETSGRSKPPEFAKRIRRLPKLVEGMQLSTVTPAALDGLGESKVRERYDVLSESVSAMESARDVLETWLGEQEIPDL